MRASNLHIQGKSCASTLNLAIASEFF